MHCHGPHRRSAGHCRGKHRRRVEKRRECSCTYDTRQQIAASNLGYRWPLSIQAGASRLRAGAAAADMAARPSDLRMEAIHDRLSGSCIMAGMSSDSACGCNQLASAAAAALSSQYGRPNSIPCTLEQSVHLLICPPEWHPLCRRGGAGGQRGGLRAERHAHWLHGADTGCELCICQLEIIPCADEEGMRNTCSDCRISECR